MQRPKLIKTALAFFAAFFILFSRPNPPFLITISESDEVPVVAASEGLPAPIYTVPAITTPSVPPEKKTIPVEALSKAIASVPVPKALDIPAQLSIPSLRLSAKIQGVGVDADGRMSVPTEPHTVGWYAEGTIPGAVGSAVLDAHVYAAFKTLKNINIGSSIYVTGANGAKLHFMVADIRSYIYNEVPTDLLFERADVARLNLITCSGTWLPTQGTYDHRLVIYAELAD